MDFEARLEDILDADITIASPNWMVVGRQVQTDHGGWIDLLAIDRDGNLVVIELKRAKTPRDIVAQTLDYGFWVSELTDVAIAKIFENYLKSRHPERGDQSIDAAFCERVGVSGMPDELNRSQELVIVAASLDPSTERIVNYLAANSIAINAIFFRVFKDGDRESLARAWLTEPSALKTEGKKGGPKGEWNGEYYVSFGINEYRSWDEAVKYGFINADGGPWYTGTLGLLSEGDRIWVNVPSSGFVGVGVVKGQATVIDDFEVRDDAGHSARLVTLPIKAAKLPRAAADLEKAAYMVPVEWVKTVPQAEAIHEKGFFGNQNTVARPKDSSWDHTIQRLKKHFGFD
jgi:hypothetical protein